MREIRAIVGVVTVLLGLACVSFLALGVTLFSATYLAWAMIFTGLFLPALAARLFLGTLPEIPNADWITRRLHCSDKERDVLIVSQWEQRARERRRARGRWWDLKNLLNTQGIGKQWAGGYTIHLDAIARDITREVRHEKVPPHLYGRRGQVEILERMLARSAGSANVALVGPSGVGRHEIVR